ncbi:MAG: hypothetical protein ACRC7N_18420, partial [Clostridium sp.]
LSDFISSYHIDIWSDDTPENTNNIRTHFNTKGYSILGKRLASLFIADGFYNKKSISSGSSLLIREQVDSVKYINSALNLEVNKAYTPQERNLDKSIICRLGTGGKIAYSFYAEQDDLYVIPTVYVYANKKFKMSLDFGIEQQRVDLTTKYIPTATVGELIPSELNLNSTVNKTYYKDLIINNNIEPLRIVKRGWHTITIESDDAVFSGLEFISKNEFDLLKKQFKVVNESGLISIRYDGKYSDLIGKLQIPLVSDVNVIEISGIPTGFTVLNRYATITNKLTKSYCSCYKENDKECVEVVNNGTQSEGRIAYVDYRLFGYYL